MRAYFIKMSNAAFCLLQPLAQDTAFLSVAVSPTERVNKSDSVFVASGSFPCPWIDHLKDTCHMNGSADRISS